MDSHFQEESKCNIQTSSWLAIIWSIGGVESQSKDGDQISGSENGYVGNSGSQIDFSNFSSWCMRARAGGARGPA
jgi:hypothetical protein